MTDHTEMQIPDELRVELAKDYVRQNFESGEPWSMTIARAILAERERCYGIADKLQHWDVCYKILSVDK